MTSSIPKVVFIVPYRNRPMQKAFFLRQMGYVLQNVPKEDYRILFSHQCDSRDFNRGAMKNIGFLVVRELYPNDYKNITLVFNDVDTMPYEKDFFQYETTSGTIKHFYGFTFALGGILSITGGDFERIGGYPNFWGWGYEDNMLQKRVLQHKLTIDRDVFYTVNHIDIIHLGDGKYRTIHGNEYHLYKKQLPDGYWTIKDLEYSIPEDDSHMIQVTRFSTGREPGKVDRKVKDLTKGHPFSKRNPSMGMALGKT